MNPDQQRLIEGSASTEDAAKLAELADQLRNAGDLHGAATALDRAFGLDSANVVVRQKRQELLDQLSVQELGLVFRYIPAGTFIMGSNDSDPDEQPVHPVTLDHFWLTETPVSWADFCRLMDWEPPPVGLPKDAAQDRLKKDTVLWDISALNRVRLQYCEDETLRARDWHCHAHGQMWQRDGKSISAQELFGSLERADANKPWGYSAKPMVAVSLELVEMLCVKLSPVAHASAPSGLLSKLFDRKGATAKVEGINYHLPTEAEWEKAARGGLIGCRYPWGNEVPTVNNCDFGRFDQFSILPMKRFPPNDYGLYAMSGCVWEWTNDWYDSRFFSHTPARNPRGLSTGKQKVVRGGSWADSSEAVTVTFRMSMANEGPPSYANPNLGFRLCRSDGNSV
jgi:formylglycine-generating enzyme required for sulfatase activity